MHAGRSLAALLFALLALLPATLRAGELDATVTFDTRHVQGTGHEATFEALRRAVADFLDEQRFTDLRFARRERIKCTFYFNVRKYDPSAQTFETTLTVSSSRPVYGASYTSPVFIAHDASANFRFAEFDKLEFRPEAIDRDLTALLAYYAYVIIGIDLDTMSPLGGTDVLGRARDLVNNARSLSLSAKGWKAFDDNRNRHGLVTDWLDPGMEPFRRMIYAYHRNGLDHMVENPERARVAIVESLRLLAEAHDTKKLSALPQLFTECKADELVGLFAGHTTAQDRDFLVDLFSRINPSKNPSWNRIRDGK